ncbi:MAG: hypothetical protein R2801_01395 [Chitinophagales bacterium]
MIKQFFNYIEQGIYADTRTAQKPFWHYAIGILFLLLVGIKLYANLEQQMDIQFADEAAYLRFGLDIPNSFNRNWGPLYCLWYKVLSFITIDTIKLYYLNYRLLGILLPVLVYILLLRININALLAVFMSFCLLTMESSVIAWPRISHFCLIILVLGLINITYLKDIVYKLLFFAIICLLCSYARPEFYLSFLMIVFILVIYLLIKRKTLVQKHFVALLAFVALVAVLHFIFRFPSNDFFGYKRSVAAFFQHFAFGMVYQKKVNADAWLIWEDLAKQYFGTCDSLLCLVKTNPKMFFSHLFLCIKILIVSLFVSFPNYCIPLVLIKYKKIKIILTILFYISFAYLLLNKNKRNYFLKLLQQNLFILILLICFVVPTFISCILYFPRMHYIYMQSILYIVVLAFLFETLMPIKCTKYVVAIVLVFSSSIILINGINYKFLNLNQNKEVANKTNQQLINYLQSLPNKKHTVFTNMPFVTGMLDHRFKEVNTIFDKKKTIPFKYYLENDSIDIIIVSETLLRDPHLSSDTSWNNFYNNYEQFSFKQDSLASNYYTILIKE